jgi:Mg-chelatase subunit ChlD/uncharacterized protein involved in exopolysaccharide biosynthesis
MKPEKPKTPRQELEATLTALLLGELPAEKAAALRELMAKDAELARLYKRMEQTIGLVRETAVPAEETTQSAPLKLSNKRREQLLQHFKTIAPREFTKPERRKIAARELAVAAGFVALIGVGAWLVFNSTQQSFSSISRIRPDDASESASQLVAMRVASAPAGSLSDQTVAEYSINRSLAGAPSTFSATLTAGGGGGDMGRPSQTIFDHEPAQQPGQSVIVASAGKPIANQIVLPARTDYALNGKDDFVRLTVSTNSVAGDPQWLGLLERGDHSALAHSSTNQFVSRFASIAIPTNQLEDVVSLLYEPRVPALATNLTATNSSGFAYYSDLNRNGLFGPHGSSGVSNKSGSGPTEGFGWTGTGTARDFLEPQQLNNEIMGRQAGGLAWSDNMHSKNGDLGFADGAVQQMSRSKLQEGLRNSSEKPAESIPVIDPATGLPVAPSGEYVNGAIDPATGLPIPADVAEAKEVPALRTLATREYQVDTNAFFTAIKPSKEAASQTPYGRGGSRGGGAGGDGRVTVSGQMPARTLREPALAPAQAPAATSPSTPLAREKLAELAQKSKDASGSNIYLGTELAKADVKFGTWGLEPGQAAREPAGVKKEEESLKQMGEVSDGVTIAGRATTPEKHGFSLLGPKETPAPSSIPVESDSVQLGDLPTLGKAFKGESDELKFGSFDPTSTTPRLMVDTNALQPGANVRGAVVTVGGAVKIDEASPSLDRSFQTGTSNRGRIEHSGEPKITLNGIKSPLSKQGTSNVYSLHNVGYYDSSKSAESNRSASSRQPGQSEINALEERWKEQETKVRQAQANVDRLREDYNIADSMAAADAPTVLMSAESVRKLQGMRIELESQVMQQETQLDALKRMPREELVAALPTAAPDTVLGVLQDQKALADKELITKQRELGDSSPEAAKLRGQISDLKSKIDAQADGILSGLDARVAATKEQLIKLRDEVENGKTNDIAGARKTQPYWEAKRNLDEQRQFSQVLQMKIASENIEASLPKTTMVEIMDDAEPAKTANAGLWDRLRGKGKYESQARIKVERDRSDISFSTDPRLAMNYDPYFIQNEFEAIKSDKVLGKVVAELNLQKEWAKGGHALSTNEAIALLKQKLDLKPERNTSFVDIGVKSDKPEEAAKLANAVASAYRAHRLEIRRQLSLAGIQGLEERWKEQEAKIHEAQKQVDKLRVGALVNETKAATSQPLTNQQIDGAPPKPSVPPPVPQPEVQTRENAFSTFSLNVSDVAFKLAAASLEKGQMPEPANVRSEEFINAFDYRDPEAPMGVPVAFAWERARYPYAQNRDLLRFSIKTAAQGRQAGRPLNIVLLMDNSGSMERGDRVAIIREALKVLASQLQPQDKLSVITFARTAQLHVDGVAGNQAAQVAEEIGGLTPEGGTNIEEAMNLAYQTALRHYLANGINRVVLLTDGAANLGNVEPESLKQKVEANRKQGIALDCFGIGWEGFNDDLLETLSRNGDGRYGFINSPEEAATEFVGQLAGALNVAASDVKVQVEFNPARVTAYRQIGYAKHQLTKEQFRDNTVDAAEIAAQEAGNALYVIEVNPAGQGPLGTVRVRFKVPGTSDYREHEWTVPFNGNAVALDQATPAMRLTATASAFSEWLASSPYATEVTPDTLLSYLGGVPEVYGADARPKKLEWMIRQAKSLAGAEIRNSNLETRSKPEESKPKDANRVQFP